MKKPENFSTAEQQFTNRDWLNPAIKVLSDLSHVVSEAQSYFKNQHIEEATIREIAGEIEAVLQNWKLEKGDIPGTKPPVRRGLEPYYKTEVPKAIRQQNPAFLAAEPYECSGIYQFNDNADLLNYILNWLSDEAPVNNLLNRFGITSIYAAFVLDYAIGRQSKGESQNSKRTIAVLKAASKFQTRRLIEEKHALMKSTRDGLIETIIKHPPPAYTKRQKQLQVYKEKAQPKGAQNNKNRAVAVKSKVLELYEASYQRKKYWSQAQHADYIWREIQEQPITINGKTQLFKNLKGKTYHRDSIFRMIRGQKKQKKPT